jgi:hypothetical protein
MPPRCMESQTLKDIYLLLRIAATKRRPVAAIYEGLPRLFCPHLLGKNKQGKLRAFCYQYGGASGSGLRRVWDGWGGWRCLAIDKLKRVELRGNAWRTEPRSGQQHCVAQVDFDVNAQSGDDPQNGQ